MNIKKRLLPAALIVILTVGCTLLSRPTRLLFFTALAVMSAFELQDVLSHADMAVNRFFLAAYAIAQGLLSYFRVSALWMAGLFGLWAFAAICIVILKPSLGAKYAVNHLFALMWPFGFYALVLCAAGSDAWLQTLSIAVLGAWACDSMALIGGKALGKHKLAPEISPNKTWEGSIVGGLSSVLAGWLISLILRNHAPVPAGICMAVTFIASCFGQIGDLAASLFKRMAGVKDYGHLMPEHGGIMDKMDSMLFAIPAAYIGLVVFGVI